MRDFSQQVKVKIIFSIILFLKRRNCSVRFTVFHSVWHLLNYLEYLDFGTLSRVKEKLPIIIDHQNSRNELELSWLNGTHSPSMSSVS
jgi:hypothetical protein